MHEREYLLAAAGAICTVLAVNPPILALSMVCWSVIVVALVVSAAIWRPAETTLHSIRFTELTRKENSCRDTE
jgi:hypothetical protein